MKRSHMLRVLFGFTLAVVAAFFPMLGSVQAAPTATGGKSEVNIDKLVGARPLWQTAKKFTSPSPDAVSGIPPCVLSTTLPRCYSPQQIRNAYGISNLLRTGITGKGQTIVIVDASSSPTLPTDLSLYDSIYGLKDPKLNVIAPFGTPPVDYGIYQETALDVETVHSLAPDATIDLVLTRDTSQAQTYEDIFQALLDATKYAIDHNLGDAVSLSYGAGESCFDAAYYQKEHAILQEAQAKHISVFVSTGDSGAAILTCPSPTATTGFAQIKGTNGLATDPLVTSVGGTTLAASVSNGQYNSETTWNEDSIGAGATGGGYSTVYGVPNYQKSSVPAGESFRGIPDVAWVGDPETGVPVVVSIQGSTYIVAFGGTSVGAPAWAGLTALFDQFAFRRLGFLNPALYRILHSPLYNQSFHDITTGNNSVTGIDASGNLVSVTGYDAGAGWDAVTGVGTPRVSTLALFLLAA